MPLTELRLTIDSLTYGPYGLGRTEGRVIMVPATAPGDEARVRIVQERGNYAVGELTQLDKPSPLRQNPPCPYFGTCGGCPWQHIRYEAQLAAKEQSVNDALRRIGKLEGFELLPISRSPREYGYRRRIRLQADDRKRIGFHRASTHELVEIDSCLIADPQVDPHIPHARQWIQALTTPIQYVEIVRGDGEGQVVMMGKATAELDSKDDSTCARFLEEHNEIGGLILHGPGWRGSWGREKILLCPEDDLRMELDADVFSQVNQEGNRDLIREVLNWAELDHDDRVLELYSGAGNFTLPVARRSGEVVAVEGNRLSVENGKANSRLNQLENIRWFCLDVPKAIKEMRKKGRGFAKIMLNPPRSGAKGLALDLASFEAEKILYISCDPATLARDLAALRKTGYRLTRVRPFDLFPHTFHVETLAELVRS